MPRTRDTTTAPKRVVKRGVKPVVRRAVARAMSEAEEITFSPMHDNVFEALGLPDAVEHLAKAEMAHEIALIVHANGWNQKRTAQALAIAPSDVSDLLRGKLKRFSQERLERFLNALDMDVRIQIGPRPPGKGQASVTVQRVASF